VPYTDSAASEEVTLTLVGTWLHDPLDAQGSVLHLPYGPPREHGVDAGGIATAYAGRTYPVTDYGEHEEETLSASVQVPHGPTYAGDLSALDGFARAKRTLWYRDNRGRSFAMGITSYRTADQRWGALVALVLARADYDVEEVEI
jgi:hypothetical protein